MGRYKYELHFHTSNTSNCSNVDAQQGVRLYHEKGYRGIVVTDHYYKGWFQEQKNIPWEEKIDRFLEGYRAACKEGLCLGMDIILGMEIMFTNSDNHYLVYGADEEFLKKNPCLYELGIKNFKKFIEDQDIMVFQAHPYRENSDVAGPRHLHGIEIFNGHPWHDSRNRLAEKYCNKHKLIPISGSDFHEAEHGARGGIVVKEPVTDIKEFLRVLRTRDYELIRM